MSMNTLPETEIEIPFTWNGTYKSRWVDIEGFKAMVMAWVVVISAFVGMVAGIAFQLLILGQQQSPQTLVLAMAGLFLVCVPTSLIANHQLDKEVEQRHLEKRLYGQKWAGAITRGLIGSQLFDDTSRTAQAGHDLVENGFTILKTRFGATYDLHLLDNQVTLFLSTSDIKESTINREAKEWAAAHPKSGITDAYAAGRRA